MAAKLKKYMQGWRIDLFKEKREGWKIFEQVLGQLLFPHICRPATSLTLIEMKLDY
jgi:hypothetical protein